MKRYKLLKDLPFAKAGDIFKGELEYGTTVLFPEDYENYKHKLSSDEFWDFDEWFEEVKKSKRKYFIDFYQAKVNETLEEFYMDWADNNLTDLMVWFDTREEAEKHLAYLKAKAVIKQDTKGFKPDWDNEDENRYRGCWDLKKDTTIWMYESGAFKEPLIFFKSVKDVKESFEKHPNEWRTYLTYEQ